MIKKCSNRFWWLLVLFLVVAFEALPLFAYTANQVSFEFLANGAYRVNLYYTIPALREFREASIEFSERRQAEKFYFDVVRGGDFFINSRGEVEFNNGQLSPSPW